MEAKSSIMSLFLTLPSLHLIAALTKCGNKTIVPVACLPMSCDNFVVNCDDLTVMDKELDRLDSFRIV